MERFFSNLKNEGTPCTLTEVCDVNNPIIGGKIVEIRPLVPEGRFQSRDTLVIVLKEPYATNGNSRFLFKAVFVGRAAKLLNNLNLVKDDYLAFCGVVLTKDLAFRRSYTYYSQQVTIGAWTNVNKIDNCYYRRREMERWSRLVALSRVEMSSSNESSTNSERTEQNRGNIIGENDSNGDNRNDGIRNIEAVNPIVNHLYRYVKLSEVQVNGKFNVYAIIRQILKKPTFSQISGRYHHMISVIDESVDETNANGFFVHIYSKTIDDYPNLKMYDIVRFHRLKIERHDDKLDGRVFKGQDLLVFDKDNTKITYRTSKTCTLTEADYERVEELKTWMYEKIPDARPFTTLNKLQLKRQKINLSGEISEIKIYDEDSVVALRIRDGTKCMVPFLPLSFNVDSWQSVLSEPKSFPKESEEIDIQVTEPAKNFKMLKVGQRIELFSVEVVVMTEHMKTIAIDYLKFFMKGFWENLKVMSHKRTHSKTDDTSTKDLQNEQKARKRQLFNPDVSNLVFENDDTDVNATKNPNTSNVEMEHWSQLLPRIENSFSNESSSSNERTEQNSGYVIQENDDNNDNRNDGNLAPIRNDCLIHENDVEISTNADLNKTNEEVIEEANNRNNHPVNKNDIEIDNVGGSQNVPSNEAAAAAKSPSGRLIHEETNNQTNTVNNVDLMANNFERTCIDCFDNCLCSESSTQLGEFYTKWPKNPPLLKPFKIRVILLSTTPAIDETSCDDDVMLLLRYFCEPCEIFYPCDTNKEDPELQCSECGAADLPLVLKLHMFVQDRYFGAETVVILGKYAEDFFGCSVSDFIMTEEYRIKIKNMIVNYLAKSWKKKVPLVLQITPQKSQPKYHVTGILPS